MFFPHALIAPSHIESRGGLSYLWAEANFGDFVQSPNSPKAENPLTGHVLEGTQILTRGFLSRQQADDV